MIQQYGFDGAGRQIDAAGAFFRYESAQDGAGVTDLLLSIDGQNMGVFSPGDAMELPRTAKRWELKPVSSSCIGVVKIGSARITSQKLQGLVQTVDGGKARSIAGAAFIGYVSSGQTAAMYAQAELWNKSATKNLIVPCMSLATTASNTLFLTLETAQLATLVSAGKCKRLGGGFVADGELRKGVAAVQPNPVGVMKGWVLNGYSEYRSSEPFIVRPGESLRLSSYVQNVDFGVTFEWFEEPA